ncbi:kinase-like domain-containing protein [Mycena metata]|uniref:Kinase-like domain-containing protein n=1 Tax=Mycena metata TaxID=1033252 RepID=A0AAD7JX84_9AGAR|nr:kinase-like domain-containing protein [Mycena metata]
MADTEIASPAEAWIIRPDELHLVDNTQIGGRQIAEGRWRNSLVMVKVLSKQAEPNALHVRGELWTSLHHPNVLQMFGVSPVDADPLYVVTQFQPDGNVNRFLEQHPQADRAKIVCDTAAGMQYLHSRGVVHGSLKPPNILVRVDGRACVSDYGMIEVQTSGGSGHRYFSPEAWKGVSGSWLFDRVSLAQEASRLYLAPQMCLLGQCALLRYVCEDSWVLVAFSTRVQIFTSKAPWGILSEKQIFRLLVRQDSRPDRPDEDFGLTDHMWGIMEKCWQRDSRQRPAFDAIIQLLQSNIRISADFRGKLPRFTGVLLEFISMRGN